MGKLAFVLSRGRIKTHLVKEDLRRREHRRQEKARLLQEELDKEHARGWGYRAIDGAPVAWEPFTKASEQERRESWQG